MTKSPLFSTYRQGENRVTSSMLAVFERIDLSLVEAILAASSGGSEVRRLNGTASSVLGDDELMRAALPALRADYQIAETHRCAPSDTVRCPVTVLTGDSDPKTTLDEANGWARHTTAACDVRVFPGGHFFLTDHVDTICGLLREHFQAERATAAS